MAESQKFSRDLLIVPQMFDYCQLLVSNFNRLAKTTAIPKTHWYLVRKYQRNSSMNKVTSLLRSFLNNFTKTSNYSKTDSYHYAKSVRIRSYSGRYFATLGLNTERYSVSLRIQSKCEKIRTRITPNMDTFLAVSPWNLCNIF